MSRPVRSLALLALAACAPAAAVPAARAPSGGPAAAPRAAGPAAPAGQRWIEFAPQSTSLCVRLPDGQYRSVVYGVGTGFVLQRGHELTLAGRDAICGPRQLVVLGSRGELAYAYEHDKQMHYEMVTVEPAARSVGWIGNAPCYVDAAGKVACVTKPAETAAQIAALLDAAGPVRRLVRGVACAVMRDGRVLCGQIAGPATLIPMWSDVVQASIYPTGWSGYAGCAVLRGGRVSCLGDNALGQRGFAGKVDPHVATIVPGLSGVDEVAASPANTCARRGGEVWCWGSAGQRVSGDAAYAASRPMPHCKIDRAATAAARKAYEDAQRTCHDPKRARGGDDPFCRSMWRASPPGPVFEHGGRDCDPTQGGSYYRWAPPTRVAGISDAVAIGTNGGLACALRASGALTCWGEGQPGTRTIAFPPRTAPAAAPAGATVARRGLAVSVSADRAIVTSASGGHVAHVLDQAVGPATALDPDVIDAIARPHGCELHGDGHVTCGPPGAARVGFPTDPAGVRLATLFGQGCLLRRDGVLRCGPEVASQWAATRAAASLDAAAPVLDAGGRCALGADGAVRCVVDSNRPLRTVFTSVRQMAFDAAGMFGCVLTTAGAVACTGRNDDFQRGDQTAPERLTSPGDTITTIAGLPAVTRIAVSTTHACAIAKDGSVWCWGRATEGETGAAAYAAANTRPQCPYDRARMAEAARAMARAKPACRAPDAPASCRPEYRIQQGGCEWPDAYGPTRRLATPMRVPGVTGAIAIGLAPGRSCAVTSAGELACWGRGMKGVQRARTRIR